MNSHISGAHDDLQRVTKMAYSQIRSFGMNSRVGFLSFPSEEEQRGQRPYSQKLARTMDEVRRLLPTRYQGAAARPYLNGGNTVLFLIFDLVHL